MAATTRALSEETIVEIISRIEDGQTLKQSCAQSDIGYANCVKRIGESEELTKAYARAKDGFARYMVQHMFDVAKDETIDVQRAKLIVDTAKWYAARTLPKEYGERTAVDVTTNKVDMTREELETQIKQLLRSGRMRLVPESQVIDAEAKQLGQGDD
jgi:hypothetical protein